MELDYNVLLDIFCEIQELIAGLDEQSILETKSIIEGYRSKNPPIVNLHIKILISNIVIKKSRTDFDLYNKFCRCVILNNIIGENQLIKLIQDDNLNDFIYQTSHCEFDFNHCFDLDISVIDYSALQSSINIFKYLLNNKVKVTDSLMEFAIAGGNYEIISIVEDYFKNAKIPFSQNSLIYSIRYYRTDVFDYFLLNYLHVLSSYEVECDCLEECIKCSNFCILKKILYDDCFCLADTRSMNQGGSNQQNQNQIQNQNVSNTKDELGKPPYGRLLYSCIKCSNFISFYHLSKKLDNGYLTSVRSSGNKLDLITEATRTGEELIFEILLKNNTFQDYTKAFEFASKKYSTFFLQQLKKYSKTPQNFNFICSARLNNFKYFIENFDFHSFEGILIGVVLSDNYSVLEYLMSNMAMFEEIYYKKQVEILVKLVCQVLKFENEFQAALFLAAEKGFLNLLKLFLVHHIDFNQTTPEGFTLLHFAVMSNLKKAVRLIMENSNINIEAKNIFGFTALDYCRNFKLDNSLSLLEKV